MSETPRLPDKQRDEVAKELARHHPTRGMAVTMGVTCECGYWTGSEPEAGKRPLSWGRDQLDPHRADVIASMITEGEQRALREAISDVQALTPTGHITQSQVVRWLRNRADRIGGAA